MRTIQDLQARVKALEQKPVPPSSAPAVAGATPAPAATATPGAPGIWVNSMAPEGAPDPEKARVEL
ncbi:hypothetical protein QTI66_38175 [Variovorax sp. J22R133]|uniref:hypothetical protein n=1 Tax=Variovorax brevis TaxID=3053503 RepID=UPI0025766570|nr:hypothetical protein [Variovorax sp. J22R133]MDM0117919.1 hypothetical protein [Variovorax sp. J22R133]